MKAIRNILAVLLLSTLPLSGAEIVVPVAGVTSGGFGSYWQSDLTIHNVGSSPAEITLTFATSEGPERATEITVGPKETRIYRNVVGDQLGVSSGIGALILEADAVTASKLSVASRTFTVGDAGQLGQDIPAYREDGFARSGETAVISGPVDVDTSRFNFGMFAAEDARVELALYRADGTLETEETVEIDGLTQLQYTNGVESLLKSVPMDGDTLYARVVSGAVVFYGSIVANDSNDPSFVPQNVTRENYASVLVGVDVDEDGTVDIADADGDGVLDQPIRIAYTGFPYTIDVIAIDPEGNQVTLDLLNEAVDIKLYGGNVLQIYPVANRRGTSTDIILRASDGALSTEFILPVDFL